MQKDMRDTWTAALRSGKYKQSRGFLKSDKGHCCLGVLLETIPDTEWHSSRTNLCGDVIFTAQVGNICTGDVSLNDSLIAALEMPFKEMSDLINMNDAGVYDENGKWTGHSYNFNEIADHIEAVIPVT